MPRVAVEDNQRVSLRIGPREKAVILRGSVLANTDLTDFMIRTALSAAQELIERAEHVTLSERDSLRVLKLLENPPEANAKLRKAAELLRRRS